jgi:hypothetical protein
MMRNEEDVAGPRNEVAANLVASRVAGMLAVWRVPVVSNVGAIYLADFAKLHRRPIIFTGDAA